MIKWKTREEAERALCYDVEALIVGIETYLVKLSERKHHTREWSIDQALAVEPVYCLVFGLKKTFKEFPMTTLDALTLLLPVLQQQGVPAYGIGERIAAIKKEYEGFIIKNYTA